MCFSELVLNACSPLLRSVHIYSLSNPAADAFLAFTNDGDCQIVSPWASVSHGICVPAVAKPTESDVSLLPVSSLELVVT